MALSVRRSVSFVELTIGFLILSVLLISLSRFFQTGGKSLSMTREYNQAVILSKKIVELARATPFDNLSVNDAEGDAMSTFEYDLNNELPDSDRVPTVIKINQTTYECWGTVEAIKDTNDQPSDCKSLKLELKWRDTSNKENVYRVSTILARVE